LKNTRGARGWGVALRKPTTNARSWLSPIAELVIGIGILAAIMPEWIQELKGERLDARADEIRAD
jgi:hypothetical protein